MIEILNERNRNIIESITFYKFFFTEGNIQECKLKFDLQEKHLYDLSKEKINFKILKTMNEFINMRLINWWKTNLPKIQKIKGE